MIRIFPVAILLAACAHAKSPAPDNTSGFFGVATLKADGEICLQTRSKEPGFPVAEGYFCYKPDHPQYKKIREHVGEIEVGKEKIIAPFK